MMNPQNYIDTKVVGAPLNFEWRGESYHSGSPSLKGPLIKLVSGRNTCGTISLLAGIAEWAACRLHGHIETEDMLMHVEAAFAYQIDWRYVELGESRERPPDQPPATSTSLWVVSYMRQSLNHERYWNRIYQPVRETYHSAHIVKHIMPSGSVRAYGKWLKSTAQRLAEIAPRPDGEELKKKDFDSEEEFMKYVAPYRGDPLPPQVLDPEYPYDPANRKTLTKDFLAGLDWKANPYLREPDAMLELGFEGTPYQLG